MPENSAEGLGSRRERCQCYVVFFVFQNWPKNLVVQGRVQLVHCSHIVTVSVETTSLHFNPWHILKETTKPGVPFGIMPEKPWHSCKSAKPDHIQLNCREVRTHASYKTTRTWENFNRQGTKMIFLSVELWLIANNSNSFENGSKSIIRNNLDSCKHSEIYFI